MNALERVAHLLGTDLPLKDKERFITTLYWQILDRKDHWHKERWANRRFCMVHKSGLIKIAYDPTDSKYLPHFITPKLTLDKKSSDLVLMLTRRWEEWHVKRLETKWKDIKRLRQYRKDRALARIKEAERLAKETVHVKVSKPLGDYVSDYMNDYITLNHTYRYSRYYNG